MGLFEFEGREVIGQGIICCVFKICGLPSAWDAGENWETGLCGFTGERVDCDFWGRHFRDEGVGSF